MTNVPWELRKRGRCSECHRFIALRLDGMIYRHSRYVFTPGLGTASEPCPGWGKPPEAAR